MIFLVRDCPGNANSPGKSTNMIVPRLYGVAILTEDLRLTYLLQESLKLEYLCFTWSSYLTIKNWESLKFILQAS